MSATLAPQVDIAGGLRRQPATARRRGRRNTPSWLRALAAAAAVATVALVALLVLDVRQQDQNLRVIGDQAAPEVAAAGDLYFALNDMDAQVADVLLVGSEQGLGFTRDQALTIYEQRRRQADGDLQQAAAAAIDPGTRQAIRDVLDQLGRYEASAAGDPARRAAEPFRRPSPGRRAGQLSPGHRSPGGQPATRRAGTH